MQRYQTPDRKIRNQYKEPEDQEFIFESLHSEIDKNQEIKAIASQFEQYKVKDTNPAPQPIVQQIQPAKLKVTRRTVNNNRNRRPAGHRARSVDGVRNRRVTAPTSLNRPAWAAPGETNIKIMNDKKITTVVKKADQATSNEDFKVKVIKKQRIINSEENGLVGQKLFGNPINGNSTNLVTNQAIITTGNNSVGIKNRTIDARFRTSVYTSSTGNVVPSGRIIQKNINDKVRFSNHSKTGSSAQISIGVPVGPERAQVYQPNRSDQVLRGTTFSDRKIPAITAVNNFRVEKTLNGVKGTNGIRIGSGVKQSTTSARNIRLTNQLGGDRRSIGIPRGSVYSPAQGRVMVPPIRNTRLSNRTLGPSNLFSQRGSLNSAFGSNFHAGPRVSTRRGFGLGGPRPGLFGMF